MLKTVFFNLGVLLLALAVNQKTHAQMTPEQYSQANYDFKAYFTIDDEGQVRRRVGVKVPGEISSTVDNGIYSAYLAKKDGSVSWYVGSQACSQNKEFTCLSVYNQNDVKVKGNSQNPFGSESRSGDYTLYRMNTKDPKQSSVVACSDTKLMVNAVRDDASLKNCNEYSVNSCNQWLKVLKEDPTLTSDLEKNEALCKDLLSRGDKLRNKMNTIFQSNLKDLSKEISSNFDKSTTQGGLHVVPKTTFESDAKNQVTLNKDALLMNDVINRTNDCAKYVNIFDGSTTKRSAATRRLQGLAPAISPATSPTNSKVKANN